MRTISQVVDEVLSRSPFLSEAIAEGIGNNATIARKIRPDVEKRLYEKVSQAAIAMALHRMKKNLKREVFGMRFLKSLSDITVRSNLVEYSCPNSVDLLHVFEAVSKRARNNKNSFLNFSRGLRESLLIVNTEYADDVQKMIGQERGLKKIESLSAITMHLPEASLNVPGVYYPVLKALAMEGISFVEVMSVRTEFSIIFEDRDVDRAFSVLKRITS